MKPPAENKDESEIPYREESLNLAQALSQVWSNLPEAGDPIYSDCPDLEEVVSLNDKQKGGTTGIQKWFEQQKRLHPLQKSGHSFYQIYESLSKIAESVEYIFERGKSRNVILKIAEKRALVKSLMLQ